ncbi:hypothetical protein MKW98_019258 [Papaver atlanticum]|uniref:Uncharacterized protein n=1 Tax=Papaver atlanticum TaxID=357466 RepID=A0AAD4XV48_9MAGN|nr:hypothetical protein MKW98_019258 [Papaver atlanticum]
MLLLSGAGKDAVAMVEADVVVGLQAAAAMDSKVLSENSSVFANLIADCHKNSGGLANLCRIEVHEVENLRVYHQTIEIMFADDIMKSFVQMGVSKSIDALEIFFLNWC